MATAMRVLIRPTAFVPKMRSTTWRRGTCRGTCASGAAMTSAIAARCRSDSPVTCAALPASWRSFIAPSCSRDGGASLGAEGTSRRRRLGYVALRPREEELQLHGPAVCHGQDDERGGLGDAVVAEDDGQGARDRDHAAAQPGVERDRDGPGHAMEGQVPACLDVDRLTLGGCRAQLDRGRQAERRRREEVGLDGLATQLTVATVVVALEGGEVRGDLH